MSLLLFTAIYSVLLSTLLIPNYVNDEQMALLQATTIPITALARLPQIFQIWQTGSAGQLSSISLFLVMAGSLARLYTTSTEVKDPILLIGFTTTALLNTILFLQVLFVTKKIVKFFQKETGITKKEKCTNVHMYVLIWIINKNILIYFNFFNQFLLANFNVNNIK